MQSIIDSLSTAIIETLPPPTPTAEHWRRYRELLNLEKPTVGQQREFADLVKTLKLTATDCKLHKVIIQAAETREEQLRGKDEKTLQDADFAACEAERVARQKMVDTIGELLGNLQQNTFSECAVHNAARDAVRMFLHNRSELEGIYGRWWYLFGLPEPAKSRAKPSSTHPPDEIAAAQTALGINSIFQD
jgi:hypothetical protein